MEGLQQTSWESYELQTNTVNVLYLGYLTNAVLHSIAFAVFALGKMRGLFGYTYKSTNLWFFLLLSVIASAQMTSILGFSMKFLDDDLTCKIVGWITIISYCGASGGIYCILFLRSRISNFHRPKILQFLEVSALIVFLFFVIATFFLVFLRTGGYIVPLMDSDNMTCIIWTDAMSAQFMVSADAYISFVLMALFLYPLIELQESDLLHIAKKNGILSCLMLVSTSGTLIIMMIYSETPELQARVMILTQLDLTINVICCCLLTSSAWKPISVQVTKGGVKWSSRENKVSVEVF